MTIEQSKSKPQAVDGRYETDCLWRGASNGGIFFAIFIVDDKNETRIPTYSHLSLLILYIIIYVHVC